MSETRKIIMQSTMSGLLIALSVIIGVFAGLPFIGQRIYLLPLVVFLYPLALRLPFLIIATSISVVLTDLFTGWIGFTWISLIAYNGSVIIIWLCYTLLKWKITYMVGTIAASIFMIGTYYFLETVVIDHAYAIKDLISTSIQMAISLIGCWILYLPFKMISTPFKI